MSEKREPPVHPGEVLQHDCLAPLEMSQYRLAKAINVPPRRINEIVQGKRGITADTALRLARFFGGSAEFWMRLQTDYDLAQVRDASGADIERTIAPLPRPEGKDATIRRLREELEQWKARAEKAEDEVAALEHAEELDRMYEDER